MMHGAYYVKVGNQVDFALKSSFTFVCAYPYGRFYESERENVMQRKLSLAGQILMRKGLMFSVYKSGMSSI